MEFMFENLEVYKRALTFVSDVDDLLEKTKGKIPYARQDQLARASLSIPLNIAEGNGRWHSGDRRQFITIARGSAFECVPLLQSLRNKEVISDIEHKRLYGDLQTLAKMLTNLMKYETKKESMK